MIRICFFLFFVMTTTILLGQDTVEKLINQGYDKYIEGDYKGAILDYNKALAYTQNNAELYYLRGVSYSSSEQKQEAMKDFNQAISLNPKYEEAYYERGYLYLVDQNAGAAIREFTKVLELNPKNPQAFVSRGTAKCMLDDKSGAQADWDEAKKLGVDYGAYMVCE